MRLEDVERVPITDYRLMLFTVFNAATLNLGGDFKYQTPDEELDEFERQIKYFRDVKGFFRE